MSSLFQTFIALSIDLPLLEQQQTRKLYQILLDLELHISLFSARIPKQTRRHYLVVSMIQEWMLQ